MAADEEMRLTELEVRYTYLEQAVRDLDQVVIHLRAQLDRMERELKDLLATEKSHGLATENEKPPHY